MGRHFVGYMHIFHGHLLATTTAAAAAATATTTAT
jgi:hypothetical protein